MHKSLLQSIQIIEFHFQYHSASPQRSGSLMTVTCKCVTSTNVSCLHFGQNSGKFFSSVSFLILVRLLLPQTGQYIHCGLVSIAIFLLQVSILHIVHFAGLDLGKPRHRAHCHIRIPMSAAILLRYVVLIPE